MKEYPRLDSTGGVIAEEVEVDEITVLPLLAEAEKLNRATTGPQRVKPKEASIQEYVDMQCNKVVAFLINWIKTVYTKDLMTWINSDFKKELIKELKK